MEKDRDQLAGLGEYKYGFSDPEHYVFKSRKGLSREIVEEISWMKGEPDWMRRFRLKAYEHFIKRPMPVWGADLSGLDLDDIYYYVKPTERAQTSWDEVPESIKRTFERLGIPEAERKFLAGAGAQYECLSGDARVYTARGLIPIRDVQAGDVVFSFDEATNRLVPARVKSTAAKGERPVFRVRVGTRCIKATANHPFLVLDYQRAPGKQRGRYRRAWKYLSELKPGDWVAVAKSLPDTGQPYSLALPAIKTRTTGHNQFKSTEYEQDISHLYTPIVQPTQSSVDLMWWLGLYVGDGFIHHQSGADKARVEFAIPETDKELRAELARVTRQLFDTPVVNGDPQRVTIYSTVLARYLEANGFGGNAHTKRIPQWVFTLPREQMLAFLGGYVDSDGYVRDSRKSHDVVLTSANELLLQDAQALCALCGLPTSMIHRFESRHPFEAGRSILGYRMEIEGEFERLGCRSPQRTRRFGKRKYYHNYSSAHQTSFRRHTNEFIGFVRIDSIEAAGHEQVYDIEVEGPHNFVAEGLIVHNSEVVYHNIQESLARQGVIFLSIEDGLKHHPDLFKKYFGTVVPPTDNKFAALNSAVWSGGSFVYVPPGVRVELPLQAYFRVNAQQIGQFERTLIIADEGSYVHYIEGCFTAGARVRTRDGEKPIEDIRAGDEVLTHRGRYRRVYKTMRRPYQGYLYHIRYYGDSSRTLNVTSEHPLLVVRREQAHTRNRRFKTQWVMAQDLKPGDYLAIPIMQTVGAAETYTTTVPLGRGRHAPSLEEISLSLTPDLFRLIGYYLAEGHVEAEHYLTFSFHEEEKGYLRDVAALLEQYFGRLPIENMPRQPGQTLVLCSTPAARLFAREFGSTAYDRRVPEWVRTASPDCLAALVQGMWRGDGSYDAEKNMFRFSSVSPSLAYAFRDALLRLGIAASVNIQPRDEPRQPLYTVVISSPWNEQFGEMVGCPARAGRQSGSPFVLDDRYMYVPIRSIETEPVETIVYNFSVEEDESYVAEGVVSHNCTAPIYSKESFHSGVIEIVVHRGARMRYTTIQNWSNNMYNLVTQRSAVYGDAMMEWVDANLGCLAQGSTVTTPDGLKPIEEVAVGDQVLAYDEAEGRLCFRRVLAKRFSGYQPVRTVSVGERKLRVTANHPFYSYVYEADAPKKLGRYRLAYVRADCLQEAIVPCVSLDYGKPHRLLRPSLVTEFVSRNQYADELVMTRELEARLTDIEYTTDDIMWLFGYWLGDGDIQIKEGKTPQVVRWAKVGFSTPATDRARNRLMHTMSMVIDAPTVERADGVHIAWHSKELAEFFRANGFTGRARDKRVPPWVWSLPESQRLAFIAGYLDADGCVHPPRSLAIKSANRALLEDIASLLVTLGITSRLRTNFDTPRRVTIMGVECVAHSSYSLVFPQDARLLPYLSPTLRQRVEKCPRPQFEYHRSIGRSNIELPETVQVVKVQVSEPTTESVPTWDIEVEGTGNFVSQGFIVHNSKVTMKYPACFLLEPGARGEILSIAFAGKGQHQDAGGKMIHAAPHTRSKITSKSISKDGGRASYRGLLKVYKGATGAQSHVQCDALLLDEHSRTDTYPVIEIDEEKVTIGHEATVSKIGDEQLFYLMSRGLNEVDARTMVVSGFIEPLVKELPMEYAVEMNRLIQLQMEGTVG